MFRRPLFVNLVVLCLFHPAATFAQEKTKRTITVDDYFTQADIFEFAQSSYGIAYTEGRWQKSTDDRKTDLWITSRELVRDLDKNRSRRLTFDRASYRSPQWRERDGNYAVFVLANRKREGEKRPPFDGKSQVWRVTAVPTEGIEPMTQVDGGVEAYQLVGGEIFSGKDFLLYLVHREHQDEDFKDLRENYKQIEYGHGVHKTSQIWKLDLRNFRTEKLVDAGRYIHEFSMASDGRLAMITAPDEKVVSFEGQSRIDIWEAGKITTLPDGLWRKKAPSPYAWLEKLAWSKPGKAGQTPMLAFNLIFDGYPADIVVTSFAPAPTSFLMPRPEGVQIRGYGSPLQWSEYELFFLGEEKGRVRLFRAAKLLPGVKPQFTVHTPGDVVVENFHFHRSYGLAVLKADPHNFADIYHHHVSGTPEGLQYHKQFKQATNVNPQAESWKLPQLKVVSWKGARGDTVEGILELPADHEPGKKIPLVVEIHGGPTTATYFKQQFWIYGRTLLPAQGYAVLCPNYRGSTGYGDKFTTDLIGRENDIEVEDILKGVDAMIEQGIADPDRLAVSGWSNGGYLTNCLIAKTTRFKAAISGAGIVDAVMEFGSNDEPAFAIVFKQGFPWSNPDRYHKASSTYQLDKIRTPTLIHVGANDDRCPPGQSKLLFRALKEYNKVDTQLLIYPGEVHGLMKYRSRQAKLEWDLAWLKKYLK